MSEVNEAEQSSDETSPVPPTAPVVAAPSLSPPVPPPPSAPVAVKRHHIAPALIALDRVEDDNAFQLREVGDVTDLATDIARLGQLFPVDLRLNPPDTFQVITGFRRVAALKFLQRDKVLARLHTDLSPDDALLLSLAEAIHSQPVSHDELAAMQTRLAEEDRLTAAARDMLEKALSTESSLGPEVVEEEVDADELAADVTSRLGAINQDLSLIADVFADLDDERKDELLKQLRYSSELVAFLEGKL
ncbi:MAG: ParB/RepB/Spo0J family partition protein [Myxococcaceae bacterium]|nr:ParB/RepB/Spo0J family partition protein [Myxococcaceae bacterium]